MFERNRIDNARQHRADLVEITLDDGRALKGRIAVQSREDLLEGLNSSGTFVDFESFDGLRQFISKTTVRSVKPISPPKAATLNNPAEAAARFDPHAVLNVSPGADADSVRRAYIDRAKAYHPDRYANAELPDEVRDYLQAMARRINMAYEVLQAQEPAPRALRATPIWESRASS